MYQSKMSEIERKIKNLNEKLQIMIYRHQENSFYQYEGYDSKNIFLTSR